MDETGIRILMLAIIFLSLGMGVKIGQYIERSRWNQLIKDGKIRRPNVSEARRKEVESTWQR